MGYGLIKMRVTFTILFGVMLALTGCRTSSSSEGDEAEFTREFGSTGLTFGTIKALDAGDTNKAYHWNVISLKESITRAEALSSRVGAPVQHRPMLRSLPAAILGHLEKFKERSAQKAATDYLASESQRCWRGRSTGKTTCGASKPCSSSSRCPGILALPV
jgi:hypothetical protein